MIFLPPLNELLTQDQIRLVNRGTAEEKTTLLNSLDPDKRKQVLRAVPVQSLSELPDLRREGPPSGEDRDAKPVKPPWTFGSGVWWSR
jgi:hypothetical protein